MCARSGMWALDGRGMDLSLRTLLDDLCFIDERPADSQLVYDQLRRYGKLGVAGPFESTFGQERRFYSEVASVFAEQLRRLGYLDLDHPMDPAAHDALMASSRGTFEERDFRRSEVEALIGRPSLVVDKRIACYAAADPERGWVFLDYWSEQLPAPYAPSSEAPEHVGAASGDPLLRDVRLPLGDWESSLVLTAFGKYLRWGTGWWMDHRVHPVDPALDGIAEQVRAIREADPSQALGGHQT